MKIVVFGATGSVGRHVVEQALEQGHEVTAFTRDPARVTQHHERLRVAQGDVTDGAAVAGVVAGHDAVIVTIGAGRKGGVRAAGTMAIIEAMRDAGVERLICMSTLGAGDSRPSLNFLWKHVMFGVLLRSAYADHQLQERYVRDSDLDWTIVRPGAFADGPRTGDYRHGFDTHVPSRFTIARADVADFLVHQLTSDTYLGRTPAISY